MINSTIWLKVVGYGPGGEVLGAMFTAFIVLVGEEMEGVAGAVIVVPDDVKSGGDLLFDGAWELYWVRQSLYSSKSIGILFLLWRLSLLRDYRFHERFVP